MLWPLNPEGLLVKQAGSPPGERCPSRGHQGSRGRIMGAAHLETALKTSWGQARPPRVPARKGAKATRKLLRRAWWWRGVLSALLS